MFEITRREVMWGGRTLVLETGRIARQADGAVLASYGETVVLCTVVGQRTAREGQDFFPLTVNYEEKAFAAGKIPGGFFKREGRPSEKETLVSRLIDRPLRPLFVKSFRNETPGHLHGALARPDQRFGYRRHGRRVGRAHHLGPALHGPDRRLPGRLPRRRLRAEPDLRPARVVRPRTGHGPGRAKACSWSNRRRPSSPKSRCWAP